MPALFFLPWVECDAEYRVGAIRLLPYERKKKPGPLADVTQVMLDAVLSNYGNRTYGVTAGVGRAVTKATILWWDGDSLGSALSSVEVESRLQFGQLLVFSALAERRFGGHFEYWNSDTVTMIGQRFDPANPTLVAVATRRRDGHGSNLVGGARNEPLFLRPLHVPERSRVEIDFDLLKALIGASATTLGPSLLDSIAVFNRANADANEVGADVEIVMLRAAFETLLGASHKTKHLRSAFNKVLGQVLPVPAKWDAGIFDETTWRTRWPKQVFRPIDAWVQDFCHVRNAKAHGSAGAARKPPIWSLQNHLLFGSWLFPLLIKLILVDAGYYKMTQRDRDLLSDCERFLARDILAMTPKRELEWTVTERAILRKELGRALAKLAAT